MQPRARSKDTLVQDVADELVVYDCRTQQVHKLNPTAAFVWRNSDGQRSITELRQLFAAEFGSSVSEEMICWAINRLAKADLLEDSTLDFQEAHGSQHGVLKRVAGVLTMLTPIVAPFIAPSSAPAASRGRR